MPHERPDFHWMFYGRAPALHAADVGISVEQAVDVAKEAADFVLLERDLDVLRQGVEQGRSGQRRR